MIKPTDLTLLTRNAHPQYLLTNKNGVKIESDSFEDITGGIQRLIEERKEEDPRYLVGYQHDGRHVKADEMSQIKNLVNSQ